MSRIVNDISVTLICYDISNNKLRGKINHTLKDFGVRLQYSIYVCRLDTKDLLKCRNELEKELKKLSHYIESTDSLFIINRLNQDKINSLIGSNEFLHDSRSFRIL